MVCLGGCEEMDVSAFVGAYRADGHGRPAHDPAMMLALLIYAYCRGQRSSRGIERACVEDVAYRVIAANQRPDHATIARFRQRHETAMADLFAQVLELCAEADLVQVGVIAIDGTKIHANASQHAARDYEQIAKEILEDAAETDRLEDERYGEKRGDELPPELSTSRGGVAGCAMPSVVWMRGVPLRPSPSAVRALSALPSQSAGWRRISLSSARANAAYEAYRARGDEGRAALWRCAEALHATGHASGEGQRERPRLAQRQDAARLHAGL